MGAFRNWLYKEDEFVERKRVGGYSDFLGDVLNKIKENPQSAMMGASMLSGSSSGDIFKFAIGAYAAYKMYNAYQDHREKVTEKKLEKAELAQFGLKNDNKLKFYEKAMSIREKIGPKREAGVAFDETDIGAATAALMAEAEQLKMTEVPKYAQMKIAQKQGAEHTANWLNHFNMEAGGVNNIRFFDQYGNDVTSDLLDMTPALSEDQLIKQQALNMVGQDAIIHGLDHGLLTMKTADGEPIAPMYDKYNENEDALSSYKKTQEAGVKFQAEWEVKAAQTLQNMSPQQIARYAPQSCGVNDLNDFVNRVQYFGTLENQLVQYQAKSYGQNGVSLSEQYLNAALDANKILDDPIKETEVKDNVVDAEVVVESENASKKEVLTGEVIDAPEPSDHQKTIQKAMNAGSQFEPTAETVEVEF